MEHIFPKRKVPGLRLQRAQAIVEFALVLPILMMLLVGIFEVGRMVYIYSAVTNASREAVRFGSALGLDDEGYHKYKDCWGIRDRAKRSAYFIPLSITISYDTGPGPSTSTIAVCDLASDASPNVHGEDNDVPPLTSGNRVLVEVTAHYKPLINLVPLAEKDFKSNSARTVLGLVEVGSSTGGGSSSGGSSTATATSPSTAAATFTSTATATNTATPTATAPIIIATPTFLPSSTPTPMPTSTKTAIPTSTFTSTPTATGTSTPSSSCSTITANDIAYSNNTNTISMTITNPYTDVTISNITLVWSPSAGQGSSTLTLNSANLVTTLGTTIWSSLNNGSGSATLTPASTLTVPGNNQTSTITFTFIDIYTASKMKNATTITVNFSTAGCSSISKTAR